jgi:hypothetical protein
MMANPPTSLGVAVNLTVTGVYPDADRADEGRLAKVRAETRPEVVLQVWPTVECAGVKRQPMSYNTDERNEEGYSNHDEKKKEAESQPSPWTPDPSYGVDTVAGDASRLGQLSCGWCDRLGRREEIGHRLFILREQCV